MYWSLIFCNVIAPQLLWFRSVRTDAACCSWSRSSWSNVGMWLERYVIIVTSLHRDFLPSSWGMYYPTLFYIWDDGVSDLGMMQARSTASSCSRLRGVPRASLPIHGRFLPRAA
jgi:hypothetical protein